MDKLEHKEEIRLGLIEEKTPKIRSKLWSKVDEKNTKISSWDSCNKGAETSKQRNQT